MSFVFKISLLLLCPALILGSDQPESKKQEEKQPSAWAETTQDQPEIGRTRLPRFLFFGVTTTTTTLSTTTMCWYSNTAITATCSKRKRSVDDEEKEVRVSEVGLMSGQRQEGDQVRKQPRFIVYWATSTTTTTTYTATSTIATLNCTPAVWDINSC